MKFLALAFASLLCGFALGQGAECGQGKIPNSQKICFEPNYIEGCDVYKSRYECDSCEKGYVEVNGLCQAMLDSLDPLQKKIVGCLQKNDSGCFNCANGFILKDGACDQGVKNCDIHEGNACKKCQTGFSLVLGKCLHNIELGCKTEKLDHSCQQCFPPFVIDKEVSRCTVLNCQTLNDYGCITCECGYYLTEDRKCAEVKKGCIRYARGVCVNCLSHYTLKGGICEIDGCVKYQGSSCSKCGPSYEQQPDGGCKYKDCLDWKNEQCTVCEKGFKLIEGNCIKMDKFTCK